MEEPRMLEENKKAFTKAVTKSGGRVVVIVHPFYDASQVRGQYKKTLEAITRSSKVPIVVVEESHKIQSTHTTLQKAENSFFVKTNHYGLGDAEDDYGWGTLAKVFKSTPRLKTVLLGGMNCWLAPRGGVGRLNWPPAQREVLGCVGQVYGSLVGAQIGNVRLIPNLVSPDTLVRTGPRNAIGKRRTY